MTPRPHLTLTPTKGNNPQNDTQANVAPHRASTPPNLAPRARAQALDTPHSTATAHPGHDTPHLPTIAGSRQIATTAVRLPSQRSRRLHQAAGRTDRRSTAKTISQLSVLLPCIQTPTILPFSTPGPSVLSSPASTPRSRQLGSTETRDGNRTTHTHSPSRAAPHSQATTEPTETPATRATNQAQPNQGDRHPA